MDCVLAIGESKYNNCGIYLKQSVIEELKLELDAQFQASNGIETVHHGLCKTYKDLRVENKAIGVGYGSAIYHMINALDESKNSEIPEGCVGIVYFGVKDWLNDHYKKKNITTLQVVLKKVIWTSS